MLKIVRIIAFCLICLAFCTACSNTQKQNQTGDKTFTDVTGNKVVLKQKPQRIVSLNVSTDEILNDLVGPDRVAAFSKFADNESISTIPKSAREKVKLRVEALGTEGILAARPDLVIIADWRGRELSDALRGVGINVYVYKTPTTIKEIEATIKELGALTGDEAQADIMAAKMDKTLSQVTQKLGDIPKDKRVKVVALSFMGAFGGKGTTFADECNYAQLRNMILEDNVQYGAEISKEALVKMNPDLLIMPSWDFDEKKSAKQFLEDTLHDPALQSITAIQKHNLVQVHDAYLYSTSQECVYAVEELAKAAYPDKFTKK